MRRRTRARVGMAVLLPALAAGCLLRSGQRTETFRPARGGYGVGARILLPRGEVLGELLAVDDSSFVLLADSRVVVIPFSAARGGEFGGVPPLASGTPTTAERERIRLVSRLSPGITPAIMAQLLARSGQQAPEVRGQ